GGALLVRGQLAQGGNGRLRRRAHRRQPPRRAGLHRVVLVLLEHLRQERNDFVRRLVALAEARRGRRPDAGVLVLQRLVDVRQGVLDERLLDGRELAEFLQGRDLRLRVLALPQILGVLLRLGLAVRGYHVLADA